MYSLGKTQDLLLENLKARMLKLDMKPKDLAKASGISQAGLYNIIRGERFPGPDNLDRLARALQCSVAELVALPGEKRSFTKISHALIDELSNLSPEQLGLLERWINSFLLGRPDKKK